MKLIRTTIEDEIGIQIHNAKLLVMTSEEYEKIIETQEADIEIHVAAGLRFNALERQISVLRQQVFLLTTAMESR